MSTFKDIEDYYFSGDYGNAHKLSNLLAEKGDQKAIRFLGWLNTRGEGCEKDNNKAITFFERAAKMGDAEASFGIATIYYEEKDYIKAVFYLEGAKKNGFIPAWRWLGVMYHLGLGVDKNMDRAFELYSEAAKRGNVAAYYQLILMLRSGYKGLWGRMIFVPMFIRYFITTFLIASKDKNSQRLM
jgi:hypothetical protein